MNLFNFSIETEDITLLIKYSFTPYEKGARELKTGLQLEPDNPDTIDDIEISDLKTGEILEVSLERYKKIESLCYINLEEQKKIGEERIIDSYEDKLTFF